jgi:hypothetical protein
MISVGLAVEHRKKKRSGEETKVMGSLDSG